METKIVGMTYKKNAHSGRANQLMVRPSPFKTVANATATRRDNNQETNTMTTHPKSFLLYCRFFKPEITNNVQNIQHAIINGFTVSHFSLFKIIINRIY